MTCTPPDPPPTDRGLVLRLLVRDHPGVLAHVCGLVMRRGYAVDAVASVATARQRRLVWLRVATGGRDQRLCRQLGTLADVLDLRVEDAPVPALAALDAAGQAAPM